MAKGIKGKEIEILASTPDLTLPNLDTRHYRIIKLSNSLEVCLIHDPGTDKAAAAMDVGVGNYSDPEEIPGLAHCLEHALFMGTEKVGILFPYHFVNFRGEEGMILNCVANGLFVAW